MMNQLRRRSWLVFLPLVFSSAAVNAQAGSVDPKLRALAVIAATASQMCATAPMQQRSQTVDLNIGAQAKLSGLLRWLTNVGISGGVSHQSASSQGVLQRDLAQSIKASNDCRLGVFNKLVDMLLASPSRAAPSVSASSPVPAAFDKPQGRFARRGRFWIETPEFAPGHNFTFAELGHDANFVYLVDRSRQKPGETNNPMIIRLPLGGGTAQWSYQNPLIWSDFTIVRPSNN
jgi:hypothetical protein